MIFCKFFPENRDQIKKSFGIFEKILRITNMFMSMRGVIFDSP